MKTMPKVALYNGSDIAFHLPMLRELAEECDSVLEFGVRLGESTMAFAQSVKHLLISVDINYSDLPLVAQVAKNRGIDWDFIVSSSLELQPKFEVDMLFIDSLHTYDQLNAELSLFGNNAKKYIGMHDTELFGEVGENDKMPGLLHAIYKFLNNNPQWKMKYQTAENNGLTILERRN